MGFEEVEQCASSALCSAPDKRCNDKVCEPDELRCFDVSEGITELRHCNVDLTGWIADPPCEAGQFCSNDPAYPGCKIDCPAPTRCNGPELQRCTADGWVHQASCATGDLCTCTLPGGDCTLRLGSDGCGV